MGELEIRLARLEERIEGMRESTRVAKSEVDRRLDEMNELRHQIEGERGAYLTVDRYEERHEDLQRRIGALESRVSGMEGGNTVKASTVGWVLAGMTVFLGAVVVILNLVTGG